MASLSQASGGFYPQEVCAGGKGRGNAQHRPKGSVCADGRAADMRTVDNSRVLRMESTLTERGKPREKHIWVDSAGRGVVTCTFHYEASIRISLDMQLLMLTEGAKCTGVRFGGKIQDSEKILSHAFLRR